MILIPDQKQKMNESCFYHKKIYLKGKYKKKIVFLFYDKKKTQKYKMGYFILCTSQNLNLIFFYFTRCFNPPKRNKKKRKIYSQDIYQLIFVTEVFVSKVIFFHYKFRVFRAINLVNARC